MHVKCGTWMNICSQIKKDKNLTNVGVAALKVFWAHYDLLHNTRTYEKQRLLSVDTFISCRILNSFSFFQLIK